MITNKELLDFQTRKKIYNCILTNPGLHLRGISRKTSIPLTTLRYHLKFFRKYELIEEITLGRHKGIYIQKSLNQKQKKVFTLLRKETPRNIFVSIGNSVIQSKTEISIELGLTTSTVSYHLKKLIELGLVEEAEMVDGNIYPFKNNYNCLRIANRKGNDVFYRIKDFKLANKVFHLLLDNKSGLSDSESVEAFDYMLKNFKIEKPGKILSTQNYTNNIIDALFEIFPNPYCA